MRSLVRLIGLLFIGFSIVVGLAINRVSPPPIFTPTEALLVTTQRAYYVKSDTPIAGYDCPSIDCTVVRMIPAGSTVTVVGTVRGEAMIPIQYQTQAVLYVVDTWLSEKPVEVGNPLRPRGGATAICRDGWVSHSANRRGTCSHHGGVKTWYTPKP